jgi:peptidoglycan hydrolase-like protein with peptidoglycan-binding domain
MFLASKAACAGIVFLLLTTGIGGPRQTALASANLSKEAPAVWHRNDVKKMQETLRDKGHYTGKVDGVLGLRTRASVREFQKTENLSVTGKLDAQTAGKLGVKPEGRKETGYEATQGKPSACIKRAKSSGRTSKTSQKAPETVAVSESGREEREKTLQAESEGHPQ